MAATRINVSLADDLLKFFDDLSNDMGISRNAIIVMALKTYVDQQKTLELAPLMQKLEELVQQTSVQTSGTEN